MNLPVSLAGHTGRWRFHGSARLDDLLSSPPWANGGGAWIVRTIPGFAADAADGLSREVRAANAGRLDLRILAVTPERLTDGLVPGLDGIRRPGAESGVSNLELMSRVADWLADRPTVLLVGPAPPSLGPGVLTEARDLHDWTSKRSADRAVTVVVLDTPADPAGGGPIDLTVGWPVDAVLPSYSDGSGRLWRAYLHARLAWETAGDLSRAARWSTAGFSSLTDEDDDGCERLLNRMAKEEFRVLGKEATGKLKDYVDGFLHPSRSRTHLLRLVDDLLRVRAVWRPDGSGWPLPVPWASRAMLVQNVVPEAEAFLRGGLVCRPLAREVLGRCLDLESRERAVCWSNRTRDDPHPTALGRWREYSGNPNHYARVFYPADCPAEPGDSWPFTTFGEFVWATAPRSPLATTWDELRDLRNGLAHGHYLCWRVITRLLDIEGRLEP